MTGSYRCYTLVLFLAFGVMCQHAAAQGIGADKSELEHRPALDRGVRPPVLDLHRELPEKRMLGPAPPHKKTFAAPTPTIRPAKKHLLPPPKLTRTDTGAPLSEHTLPGRSPVFQLKPPAPPVLLEPTVNRKHDPALAKRHTHMLLSARNSARIANWEE